MKTTTILLALATCLLAANAIAQQQTPSDGEAAFRSAVMLDGYAKVEYREVAGSTIRFDDFMKAISGGKSFSMQKQDDHSMAVVSLKGAVAGGDSTPAQEAVVVGSMLPGLGDGMHTLDGRPVGDADLRGHPVLVSTFFAECLPCVAEIPALNAFAKTHPELRAYAITFDDAATARGFVRQRGLELPVIADAQAYLDRLQVKVYPTMLLVDAQGRIAAVRHGGTVGGKVLGEQDLDAWAKTVVLSR